MEAKLSKKRYGVEPSADERQLLEELVRRGKGLGVRRCAALLKSDLVVDLIYESFVVAP